MVAGLGHAVFRFRNLLAPLAILGVLAGTGGGPFLVAESADRYTDALGIVIVVAGIVLRLAIVGAVAIRRSGVRRRIAAPRLHRDGPYGCCRHPLYVANALVLIGLTVVYDTPVMIVALAIALAAIASMIIAEERLLAERFGDAYLEHAAGVPRFSLHGVAAAVVRTGWNPRRALRKEHGTVFGAATTLILLMLAEDTVRVGPLAWRDVPRGPIVVWLGLAVLYAGIRVAKMTGRLASVSSRHALLARS